MKGAAEAAPAASSSPGALAPHASGESASSTAGPPLAASAERSGPPPAYLKAMQRQLDDMKRNTLELEEKLGRLSLAQQANKEATASLAKKVAHYGRRAGLTLASALWCSDGQR
eukprot:5101926-Alexandrium_andersonii.AAC.1